MSTKYGYISEDHAVRRLLRRSRRHPTRQMPRLSLGWRLLLLFLLVCLLFTCLNRRFFLLLGELGEAETVLEVTELIESAVSRRLAAEPGGLDGIVSLVYKEDGSVSSMQTDAVKLSVLQSALVWSILQKLDKTLLTTVEIPSASLFGLNFLSGQKTLKIPVRMTRNIHAYFEGIFTEAGINQVLHRITFRVSIETLLMLPGAPQSVTTEVSYPISETVLLGAVPSSYTRIQRLTDDITEAEIDDIYDFGADSMAEN